MIFCWLAGQGRSFLPMALQKVDLRHFEGGSEEKSPSCSKEISLRSGFALPPRPTTDRTKGFPTEQAFKMLADLAEKGNADAMNGLGSFYYRGLGVEKDYALAARWFAKAAEKGQVQAMYSPGCCSYQGHGVPKDRVAALRWFTKAGEQGHAEGAYNAGLLHASGQGTAADMDKARTWYQAAARLGSKEAKARLGANAGGK